jgi:hypothetical protein
MEIDETYIETTCGHLFDLQGRRECPPSPEIDLSWPGHNTLVRWVQCDERMPTIENVGAFPYLTIMEQNVDGQITSGHVLSRLSDGVLIPVPYGLIPKHCRIVAWAEGIPPYKA